MKYSTIVKHIKIKRGLRVLKTLSRDGKVDCWVALAWDSRDKTKIVSPTTFERLVYKVIFEKTNKW